jgi:pyrimidine-nucleoside phosphorylase
VLKKTGCALIGQTDEIAPADRRLYAIRDVTATVESIPLICASILSKKIAEGIGALVLDVKVGSGAFMTSRDDARQLAAWLVDLARRNGLRARALLTNMEAPLGLAVGNANEVAEAIATLEGRGPADVTELSLVLAARMVELSGIESTAEGALARARRALASGEAREKFRAIVEAQGGDARVIDDPGRLPRPAVTSIVAAPRSGTMAALDAGLVGRAAVALGAGRDRAEDAVDPAAGIDVLAPVGAHVRPGDPVLRLMGATAARIDAARALLEGAVRIADEAPVPAPLVLEEVGDGAPNGAPGL